MSRTPTFIVSLATAVAALVVVAGPVSAASATTVEIVGNQDFGYSGPPGQLMDFKQGKIVVHRGDTVTWVNKGPAPHTMSVIEASEIPQTLKQVMECSACGGFFAGHVVHIGREGPEPPFVANLDTYKASGANPPQLDNRGDSVLIAPMGETIPATFGAPVTDVVSAAITAPEGTTLNYFCAIHPWMQAAIEVIH
jgi:plastocyanin